MGIKQKYSAYKFRKLLEEQHHSPVLPHLDSAKLIGVIWHPTQKEVYNYLKAYFKREQVIFRGFCVFEEEVNPPVGANALTSSDLNWLGFPKPENIEDFIGVNFDILFNLAIKQNLVLDTLTVSSKAKFKVGCSAEANNYFDLNINIGEKDDAMYLAKQQIFYLAQLNKTTK